MTGLVIFLHGLGGSQHSWGAVPDYVRDSPLGSDFDVKTIEYSAKWWSRSDIETSAQMVQTKIETDYREHEPIYFVGYSLGGLIAREICRNLLESGPDDLLNKIPAVITLGTPLEGARHGNFFLRYIPFFSPKINQLATKEFVFDNYRIAIRQAIDRSVSRPKQLHVRMEDDGAIAPHVRSHFTEDDYDSAVIPGTHRNFAENNTNASYVADVLLRLIYNEQNALSRPHMLPPEPVNSSDLPDRLILIACSHGKRDGGEQKFDGPDPAGWVPQPSLRQRIISKRSYVYSVLRDAKLDDGFERGGNRAHQPANRHLKHGPDLGGTIVEGEEPSYLPAWQRYNGRIYVPVEESAWKNYLDNRNRICVLIMSGLYGLIEAEEWIQNYDVHLTDTHNDTGQSVSSMWSELFTDSLITYVNHSHRSRRVKIFNLLCDEHYVDAIQWHKLPKECSVFHLASPTCEDVNLLPPAATILSAFLNDPEKLEAYERDDRDLKQYDLSEFGVPPTGLSDLKVIFESRVGNSKSAE